MTTNNTTAAFFLSRINHIGFGLDAVCGDCALDARRTSVGQPVVADYYFTGAKGKQVCVCTGCAKSRNLL